MIGRGLPAAIPEAMRATTAFLSAAAAINDVLEHLECHRLSGEEPFGISVIARLVAINERAT
ncbi:hypothetical protein CCC_01611 [Paramagnetospirillum magnetotacticum MS-1]|uniref:Uncharacterized protein n=1 Tax=Paramagnetospirillum magnetotacticum MS-1 TaxID=272627 RepID=A0A0C2YQ07_PARME|nr:hypothetical protein CCC_01611 [Paramagnetospirillum magnetotacticum MS-1]